MEEQSAQNDEIIKMIIETRQRRMRSTGTSEDDDLLIIDEIESVESMEQDGKTDNSFVMKDDPQTPEAQIPEAQTVRGIPDTKAPGFTNGFLEIIIIDDDEENNNKKIDDETRRELVRRAIDKKNQRQMILVKAQVQPRDERFLPVIGGEWPEVGEWDNELMESAGNDQTQNQTQNQTHDQPQNASASSHNEVAVISQNVSQVPRNNILNFTRGFSQDTRNENQPIQSRLGAIPKTNKKKYNPRRHLTLEDCPDYRRSPPQEYFGPSNLVYRGRDEEAFNANFSGIRKSPGAIRNNFRDRNETRQPWARPSTSRVDQWPNNNTQADTRPSGQFKKRTGTKYKDVNEIQIDNEIDPPPGRCFGCWQFGHIARYCPRPVNPIYCTNCGRKGIRVNECPRCKNAYFRAQTNLNQRDPPSSRNEPVASTSRSDYDDRRYALQYRPIEEAGTNQNYPSFRLNNIERNNQNQSVARNNDQKEQEIAEKERRAIELLRSLEGLPAEDKARILRQVYGEK